MHTLFFSTLLPWITAVAWIVFVCSALVIAFQARTLWNRLPKWGVIALIAVQLAGTAVRFYWVPDDHRIYFDEDRYLSYAVTFARFGKAVSVDLATPTESILGIPDDAGRTTVPVFNALMLRIFGYSETFLHHAARSFHSLSVLGIGALAYLLFRNLIPVFIAAIGIALLPTPVFFSPSFGLDVYFMDFGIWVILATVLFAKKSGLLTGLLWITSTILFLCVRIESFVFLPVIISMYILYRRYGKQKLLNKQTLPFIISILLFVLIRGAASLTVLGKPWCCAEALPLESFAFSYLIRHILPNIIALFAQKEFPWGISVLALYAVFAYAAPIVRVLTLWVLLYFVTYSAYYAGLFFNPEFSGSYGRYLLMIIPPLLLLAGYTLLKTTEDVQASDNQRKKYVILTLLLLCVSALPAVTTYRTIISYSPWDAMAENGPRLVHGFLSKDILDNTPHDAIIIHNLTAPILLAGRTVVFTASFLSEKIAQDYVLDALKRGEKVYMLPHYRCLLYPDSCEAIMKQFTTTSVLKRDFGAGATLELYQLHLPSQPTP